MWKAVAGPHLLSLPADEQTAWFLIKSWNENYRNFSVTFLRIVLH